MAKGYPDFFGIPNFPMLGGATNDAGSDTVPFGDSRTPVSVTDKGQLYWISVELTDNDSVFDCTVVLNVDGVSIQNYNQGKGSVKRYLSNVAFVWQATKIDYQNNKLELAYIGPVPFTTSYSVQITNGGGSDITAYVYTNYGKVI